MKHNTIQLFNLRVNNLLTIHFVFCDRPGESSSDENCCRWRTFQQPERRSSSESSAVICEATIRNDNNIVILPADKGRVTVVMDKTDYFDKMDPQTYEELKRNPTPALLVAFCGSPTYQLLKYVTTILQPLTDKSRRKVQIHGELHWRY